MRKKRKSSKDEKLTYSKNESFENLEAVQEMALNKRGKDDEPAPDISLFLKAEELKGKLCGLYADKEKTIAPVNVMGSVIIDGKELSVNTGSEPLIEGGNTIETDLDTCGNETDNIDDRIA